MGDHLGDRLVDLPHTSHLKLAQRGAVLHVWLNRPELRNALSQKMVRELAATFAAIAEDRDIRVVVLRGAGGTFCAGGDIKNMSSAQVAPPAGAADELKDNNRRFGAMLEAVNAAPQVVIAAVEGAAMGGGFGLACIADITVATADARFAMSEVTIGVVPAAISPFVVQRIGLTAARRLGVTGIRLNGQEAATIGIAHFAVADAAALDEAIRGICNQVLKCAPGAVAATKQLMLRAANPNALGELLDEAAEIFATAVRSAEGKEGTSAFVEKRKPSWLMQVE
jgi:isohexenylglutaconyl-CoA hydratase